MSEERIPDRIISIKLPRASGKIKHDSYVICKIELFGSYQFKIKHKRKQRNFSPRVPIDVKLKDRYYSSLFRVRINGKWYKKDKCRYCFFDIHDVLLIACKLIKNNPDQVAAKRLEEYYDSGYPDGVQLKFCQAHKAKR